MEGIFLNILNMSLTAGVIIVAVLIIRLFLKRLPKKYSYFLWSVVAFRLLCPVSFSSIFSIFNLKIFSKVNITGRENNVDGKLTHIKDMLSAAMGKQASGIGAYSEAGKMPGISGKPENNAVGILQGTTAGTVSGAASGVTAGTAVGETADAAINTVTGTAPPSVEDAIAGNINAVGNGNMSGISVWDSGWFKVLMIVWIVGMTILLIYGVVSYIVMARRVSNAVWAGENVYRSEKITSPFVFGLLRPKVYIPCFIEAKASEYVILHENYHIYRHDYIVKPAAFLLLCIHWFNPLVWISFYMMGRDMEMSCDEAVLADMIREQGRMKDGMSESEIVKGYSYALLNCASHGSFNSLFGLGFGELSVEKRIKNVLKYKKYGVLITVALILVCAIVLVACTTNSNSAKGNDADYSESQLTLELERDSSLGFTFNTWLDEPGSGITELDVKIVNDRNGNSIISWDGNIVKLDKDIIPAGIYEYSRKIDIDGDGEDERILKCHYSPDDNNTYKTVILDTENGSPLCLEIPPYNIGTAKAYDGFILKIKLDFESMTRLYDCTNPGKNEFLKELRQSLVGKVWDEAGKLINPDSKDGLSKSVEMGFGKEYNSGLIYEDGSAIPYAISYNVNVWLNEESNEKFIAVLKYKPEKGSMVLLENGSMVDMLASGKITGSADAGFKFVPDETSQDIELDFSTSPRKWTEKKLEIARSLYKDFTPCAANIDGEWIKSLYNEEHDVLIVQESNAYGIYHGDEYVSVPVGVPFPTDIYVTIKFIDANADGKDELYIRAGMTGDSWQQLIGLEPLTVLVDSYSNDGSKSKIKDYVKEYSITSVWVSDDERVHVLAEFVMKSGQTYNTECVVGGADVQKLDDFVIEPVFIDTIIDGEYPYSVKQDIRFRVSQGSMIDGYGYIFMSIPLKYDEESNHYIERGDVNTYYREISPAAGQQSITNESASSAPTESQKTVNSTQNTTGSSENGTADDLDNAVFEACVRYHMDPQEVWNLLNNASEMDKISIFTQCRQYHDAELDEWKEKMAAYYGDGWYNRAKTYDKTGQTES